MASMSNKTGQPSDLPGPDPHSPEAHGLYTTRLNLLVSAADLEFVAPGGHNERKFWLSTILFSQCCSLLLMDAVSVSLSSKRGMESRYCILN